eukprot:TRINITY_DN32387_c0_g1_i1.p1 TRINITY_DN32387_c0_g1~~TRINITY_DN32387_c0_g1_i1.p1  ORF type:complete len:217 (-),score=32.93 TRINITY_DN32387_c0_g1_i1:327-899(-)
MIQLWRLAKRKQECIEDLERVKAKLAVLEEQLAQGTVRDVALLSTVPELQPPSPELPTWKDVLSDVFAAFLDGKAAAIFRGLLEVLERELPGSVNRRRCFLPRTMIWTSKDSSSFVEALRQDDLVMNVFGKKIKVASITVHEEARCEVVELRTREYSLKVSSTHRIIYHIVKLTERSTSRRLRICREETW